MAKILIIGQAPPAVTQKIPYDTTLLYEMLNWIGISKEQAIEIFEFDAVYNKFTGYGTTGHNVPTKEQMDSYYPILAEKINNASKILVLGNVAKKYLETTPYWGSRTIRKLYLLHPSKRNYDRIMKQKDKITTELKNFMQ